MTIFETSTAFSNNSEETHPHIHSIEPDGGPIEWQPISSEEELHLAAQNGGSYYLATDINLTKRLEITKDMNLCLNDKVLKPTAGRSIHIHWYIKFNLCDCNGENGTRRYWDKYKDGLCTMKKGDSTSEYVVVGGVLAGVKVLNYGDFTLYDGNIAWNNNEVGGGVSNYGTFTMYGGSITGNSTVYAGGGVNNNGDFTLYRGCITGNSGKDGGGVHNRGTFTMHGGNITENFAEHGGGVYNFVGAKFAMNDGRISENNAKFDGYAIYNERSDNQ